MQEPPTHQGMQVTVPGASAPACAVASEAGAGAGAAIGADSGADPGANPGPNTGAGAGATANRSHRSCQPCNHKMILWCHQGDWYQHHSSMKAVDNFLLIFPVCTGGFRTHWFPSVCAVQRRTTLHSLHSAIHATSMQNCSGEAVMHLSTFTTCCRQIEGRREGLDGLWLLS